MRLVIPENDKAGCLKGVVLDLGLEASKPRTIDAEVASGTSFELVDGARQIEAIDKNDPRNAMAEGKTVEEAVRGLIASGPLLQVSSIAFDSNHAFAALRFVFCCGRLCGGGGTITFEKVGQMWKTSTRLCGQSVF
jgi:hypothetical protein